MGAFPSGQWGQTVNLLLNASVVRIHQLPPKRTRNLGCGFFFVLELVGFEQVGRPQTAKKQSCGLFFRPRLANPPAPTKKLWQRYCRSFFSLLYRTKSAKAMTDFQSAFYRDLQLLPGGWIFLLPAFSAVFRMLNFPAAGDRGVVHAHPAKSETGHRIAAGTCNPGGKQV